MSVYVIHETAGGSPRPVDMQQLPEATIRALAAATSKQTLPPRAAPILFIPNANAEVEYLRRKFGDISVSEVETKAAVAAQTVFGNAATVSIERAPPSESVEHIVVVSVATPGDIDAELAAEDRFLDALLTELPSERGRSAEVLLRFV